MMKNSVVGDIDLRVPVRQRSIVERSMRPARELASRATSKHGNPAGQAIVLSVDMALPANVIAARVYGEAFLLSVRSKRGEVVIGQDSGPGVQVVIAVDATPDGESLRDRGGFAFTFAPLDPSAGSPRFEGRIRVDNAEGGASRLIAQGRYEGMTPRTLSSDDHSRRSAESALREIVDSLTVGFEHAGH